MKVVLFCGGRGLRLREYSENTPKPMVPIGYRPIIWHLMKYYAHYGHTDFILCLGYKADVIKEYFLNYNECITNDFILRDGGRDVQLLNSDVDDWSITFVDTGYESNVGQRLWQVRDYLDSEEHFMVNYADNLTDCPIDVLIDHARKMDKVGCFLNVKPSQSFHIVEADDSSMVRHIVQAPESDTWINGGYFVFRNDIFDYLNDLDDLTDGPLQKLIAQDQLAVYRYRGFWACMDTFKEKQILDDLHASGEAPWEVWKRGQRDRRVA